MKNKTKTYNIKINFYNFSDEDPDRIICKLTVPDDITLSKVIEILKEEHYFLSTEDTEGIYNNEGMYGTVLFNYTCKKHGWIAESINFDINYNFDMPDYNYTYTI